MPTSAEIVDELDAQAIEEIGADEYGPYSALMKEKLWKVLGDALEQLYGPGGIAGVTSLNALQGELAIRAGPGLRVSVTSPTEITVELTTAAVVVRPRAAAAVPCLGAFLAGEAISIGGLL